MLRADRGREISCCSETVAPTRAVFLNLFTYVAQITLGKTCVAHKLVSMRYARVANLAFWSQILKFWLFKHLWLFWKSKKSRQNFAFFQGLALEKHFRSCIFITILLWKESITMQGAQNIKKILLLPWKWSMLLIRNRQCNYGERKCF